MLSASRCLVGSLLFVAASSLHAQDKDDVLAKTLHLKAGTAIVPYAQQSEAKVGAVVAQPFNGQLPVIRRAAADVPSAQDDEMTIPEEEMAQIKQAGLEAKLFSFDFGGKFNDYSTLSFKTLQLPGKKIEYDDVLDLVKPGSATDTLLRTYVNPNLSSLKKIQQTATLYVIGKVFTSTGVEITSTSGREITLQSGQDIPACPALPALPAVPADKPKLNPDPKAEANNGDKPDNPAAKPADKPAQNSGNQKVSGAVDVNVGGVKGGANVGGGAGGSDQTATKGIADKAAAGIKVVSPSGSVQFCRKSSGHIILTTDHPIPVAMLVWKVSLYPDLGQKQSVKDDKWKPEAASPMFVLGK